MKTKLVPPGRILARTAILLFIVSLCAIALGVVTHHFVSESPWLLVGAVVGAAAVCTLAFWELCRLYLLRPMGVRMDAAEEILERAGLMQEAMRPALSMLAEGLIRQDAILEEVSAELVARRGNDDSSDYASPKGGLSPRSRRLMATLKDLRRDAASRAQIASTLMAANETIGLRHSELHRAIRALRRIMRGASRDAVHAVGADEALIAGEADEPATMGDLAGTIFDGYPESGVPGDEPGKAPGGGHTWPVDPVKPLMPDFKLPRHQGRGRFGPN